MFQLIASASDFEWSYTETLAVYEDESVAKLVCEGAGEVWMGFGRTGRNRLDLEPAAARATG